MQNLTGNQGECSFKARSQEVALVLIVAAVFFLSPLGLSPFSSRGESREAVVVFNMVEQHNPILPLRNGYDIPSKPPFFHWWSVTASEVFGRISEFSVRFPSGIAAVLTLAIFFLFLRTFERRENSYLSTLILGTSFEFMRNSALARVDLVFTLWLTLGTLYLFRTFSNMRSGSPYLTSFAISTISLAFAALTKGPAGIVLPWAVAGLYLLATVGIKKIPFLKCVLSVALSIALAFVWYYAAWKIGGQRFLDVHLMRENVARVLGTKGYITGHASPFYSTVLLLIIGMLPWSLLLPQLVRAVWNKRKTYLSSDSGFIFFSLIWLLTYVIFFSITSSKRSVYLLPAFPALAYLLAAVALKESPNFSQLWRRLVGVPTILLGGGILLSVAIMQGIASAYNGKLDVFTFIKPRDKEAIEIALATYSANVAEGALFIISGAILIFSGVHFLKNRPTSAARYLAIGTGLFTLVINLIVYPPISSANSPREFAQEINKIVSQGDRMFQYMKVFYPAVFYAKRNIEFVATPPKLVPGTRAYMLVEYPLLEQVRERFPNVKSVAESKTRAAFGKEKLALVSFGG